MTAHAISIPSPAAVGTLNPRPVILITGTSAGLGAAMATRFSRWAHVYGTSRVPTTAAEGGPLSPWRTFAMDVTDEASVATALQQLMAAEGRIDVLINNAGVALQGASEQTPIGDFQRQMEVNFLGAVRMTHAVLPTFRRQGSGLIVNISSMATRVPLPFVSCYVASKAALEGWAWSLRQEVRPFGVGVCCVQVGDCRTEISARGEREFSMQDQGVYRSANEAAQRQYRQDESQGLPPERLAERIERLIRRPPLKVRFRHLVGPWLQEWMVRGVGWAPEWLIEAMIRRLYS